MGLSVMFVSGPRRSGKSALIQTMIDRAWKTKPHYLRLVQACGDKQAPSKKKGETPQDCGVASARWIQFDEERIFEILPEALVSIHKKDRYGSAVIEADADPILRCAYPYDHRVFIMPVPSSIDEVFREPRHAAEELRRVLDDTAAFASEIFGMFSPQESFDGDPSEDRPELTSTQMRGFLYSPLGDELATRIQLQQPYHGLVESDIIIVNTKVGAQGSGTEECLRRIQRLLDRIKGACGRSTAFFQCDPQDGGSKEGHRLLESLKPMCRGGV